MLLLTLLKLDSLILILCSIGSYAVNDNAVIHSSLGTIIGLQINTSFLTKTGKVSTFRGIPYAEAPTGDQRFKKPVPKTHLPNPFNATDYSPACPQDLVMMMGWVPGYPYVDDNCLTLNVFLPEKKTEAGQHDNAHQRGHARQHDHAQQHGHAVLVWIHGGAYVIGQSKIYNAENLTLVGDIIVVTINYRLTSLGFLSTGSKKYPGNAGLWDQQLAIQWVHDNIADFGGDPNRVTIAGESAGGSSVLYHAMYPGNKGLFRRVIAESGSPLCPWAFQPNPARYARRLADRLGCRDSDLDAAVYCLQGLDPMVIVNASRVGTHNETVFRAEWVPSIDGEFITKTPGEMFNLGTDMFRGLEYLVGLNNNDGAFISLLAFQPYMEQILNRSFDAGIPKTFFDNFYIPMFLQDKYGISDSILKDYVSHLYTDWQDPNNPFNVRSKFLDFSGDLNYFMPILSTLKAHTQGVPKANSFLYEFSLRPHFIKSPSWVVGANHGEELPFVFGFPSMMAEGMGFQHNVPQHEVHVSLKMMLMWSNFVKSGDPNTPVAVPDSVTWPRYDTILQNYLDITASNMTTKSQLFGRRTAFWLDLEPRLHKLMGLQGLVG